ncbi:hypothetical protein SPB21_25940 [Leptothoe sp. ISB3NOV94-8A]|nr:hypothetical protein [Adonisia turfae]EKV03012.1 hypothetical protein Lepto7375DRAFT_5282 [Leptolyngbya sp. PCC 7375]MDV3349661.1 hypothetical protein [Leptothoe sp. LEGE 181152]
MMDIDVIQAGDSWQNWVFTITYLSFLLFVVWRVIVSSSKPSE